MTFVGSDGFSCARMSLIPASSPAAAPENRWYRARSSPESCLPRSCPWPRPAGGDHLPPGRQAAGGIPLDAGGRLALAGLLTPLLPQQVPLDLGQLRGLGSARPPPADPRWCPARGRRRRPTGGGPSPNHVLSTAPVRRLGSGPSGVPSPAPLHPGPPDHPARSAGRAPRRSITQPARHVRLRRRPGTHPRGPLRRRDVHGSYRVCSGHRRAHQGLTPTQRPSGRNARGSRIASWPYRLASDS